MPLDLALSASFCTWRFFSLPNSCSSKRGSRVDGAEQIDRFVEVRLRNREREDRAVGADFDSEICAERFDLGEQILAASNDRLRRLSASWR